jgi:hypothetical protein
MSDFRLLDAGTFNSKLPDAFSAIKGVAVSFVPISCSCIIHSSHREKLHNAATKI